jgi:hypothetical protein
VRAKSFDWLDTLAVIWLAVEAGMVGPGAEVSTSHGALADEEWE